ncbi:MAG TPA: hypothetical protein VGI26_10025 [Solirubrobacteraceae bacterium]|jgi:hypothetical protein
MSDTPFDPQSPAHTGAQPSEAEMRAAYEAELNRITATDMILQTAVSLLNIGGRRLGLARPAEPGGSAPGGDPPASERDLEQVRDAIDGARALMPILERRMPREIGPLRDAVSQLQMAYAREVQSTRDPAPAAPPVAPSAASTPTDAPLGGSTAEPSAPVADAPAGEEKPAPGPAESSGRLWVPGR